MQRERITNLRRHTDNSTSIQKKQEKQKRSTHRNFQSLQAQTQLQGQKHRFAREYVKLTKQFQKILSKSSSSRDNRINSLNRLHVASHRQQLNKNEKLEDNQKIQTKPEDLLRKRSTKLQNLYSNRLHHQILEAAKKLEKSRKEKISGLLVSASPPQQNAQTLIQGTSSPHNVPHSVHPNTVAPVDKQIFVHLQQQKSEKINKGFNKIPETLAHFHNLYKIYELLENYKNNYSLLVKAIKKYIMNHNQADISKLQTFLKIPNDKQKLKILLCLQKIGVLGILDSMIRQNQLCVKNQGKAVLQTVFGVYNSIFTYLVAQCSQNGKNQAPPISSQCLQSLQVCVQLLHCLEVQKRKDLQSTIEFLFRKIQSLYRSSQTLFHKIKQTLTSVTKASINNNQIVIDYASVTNINRFFYFLLCEYAHWMNSPQNVQYVKAHKNMIDFFLTCPAPHLTCAPPEGKKTILFQLEGVLAMVKFSTGDNTKLSIRLRPYAIQLINQLHRQQVQIVIMTALLPENLPVAPSSTGLKKRKVSEKAEFQYQEILKLASCVLFKHHYVRYRELLVKDLSRLGRKLQNLILIDDIKYPGTLQIGSTGQKSTNRTLNMENSPVNWQNCIPVSTWKGNTKDIQLLYLKQILSNILLDQSIDVRIAISKIKESRGITQSWRGNRLKNSVSRKEKSYNKNKAMLKTQFFSKSDYQTRRISQIECSTTNN